MLIEEDLPHVREASKVSLGQLEKDMATLRTGLGDIRREMDYHRQQNSLNSPDRFLPVMEEFYSQANCKFTELEDQFQVSFYYYKNIIFIVMENFFIIFIFALGHEITF